MATIINEESVRKDVTPLLTERADEILHMILDLKHGNEVDLYRLQTLVLNMYKDEIELVHIVDKLYGQLERKKRTMIEVPKFMFKGEEAQ